MQEPRRAGLLVSRPVSRILSRVTIHLGDRFPGRSSGAPGSSAGHLVAEPVRLAPDGVWRAAGSPRRWWALTPPFHPYRRRLRRVLFAGGGLLSVPLSVGFRRLGFPQHPALRCPDFPRPPRRPRSPGLQAQLYLP